MLRSKSRENAPGVIDSRSNLLPSLAEHKCSGTCLAGLPSRGSAQVPASPLPPDPCHALWEVFLMFCPESPRDPAVV